MGQEKKKSYIARNLEWITLLILIIGGLLIIWQIFF